MESHFEFSPFCKMAGSTRNRGKKRPSDYQQVKQSLKKKPQLSVTCGDKVGVLHKDKFNKAEPCILSDGQWFTPTEFEKFGGKEKNKKWKISILHNHTQLQTLIRDGVLSSPSFKTKHLRHKKYREKLVRSRRRSIRVKNSNTSESVSTSDSSSESNPSTDTNGDDEVQVNEREFRGNTLTVKCSTGKGVLHVTRFAKETCGKCIRTQDAWLTPKDFLSQNKPNGNWRRDITIRGVPLGNLIMRRVLKPHSVNCQCSICRGEDLYVLDQNNDDECFNCNLEGDLVCCNRCPRAFHHQCHKPALRDETIGDHWTCSFCTKSVPAKRNKRS